MSSSFIGGICKRGPEARRTFTAPSPETVNEDWGWVGPETELFLRSGPGCRLFTWDGLSLLLRGYARPAALSGPLDLERVAEEIRCHYLEHGTLAVDDLEGSFTVALLDSHAERVVLYRNLVGAGFTYYHTGPDGLLFAGNLTELVGLLETARVEQQVLPAFFLYRCVPGRATLFAGVHRLLPGEQITWDRRGLTRRQRHTFANLRGATIGLADAVERVEATLTEILRDGAALYPHAANLLSGGVDSSYIQAVWNHAVHRRDELPISYSVSVDHPHTWLDTDYAITASQALGTRHVLAPADGPYAAYLIDALAATGEPLNHVQSAYFGHLARVMAADGCQAGICGEGADSLFGVGLGNRIHNARTARRLLPFRLLRRLAGGLSQLCRWPLAAATLRLANSLEDEGDLEHPVNRVAVFTDWAATEACFGAQAIATAAAERRALLELYAVPEDPMDRLHATGFLAEAMDSAGLWTTLFHRAGTDLLCPFLDSRMLRLALNLAPEARYPYRRPKALLKQALTRRAPAELATRVKLGFGQPIFEWLAPGGQLAPLVERLGQHAFVDPAVLTRVRARPTWFLYSLLVYDTWHRMFIERTLPRPNAQRVPDLHQAWSLTEA